MNASKVMKWSRGWDVVALAIVAGTFVLSAAILPSLPPVVATHFDIHGEANGFSSRTFAAYFMPVIELALWALLVLGGRLLPTDWRNRLAASPMGAVVLVTVAFLSALHVLVLRAALSGVSALGNGLPLLLGVMWLAIGVILPRTRRNPFVGIRTAWTLSSDENWARTHRIGSYAFVGAGLVALVGGAIGGPSGTAIALTAIVVSAAIPILYSWSIARHTS